MKTIITLILSFGLLIAYSDDLKIKTGQIYKDYKINKPTLRGLNIFHKYGSKTIPYSDLPDELRKKYKDFEEQAKIKLQKIEEFRKKKEAERLAQEKKEAEEKTKEQPVTKQITDHKMYIRECSKNLVRCSDCQGKGYVNNPNYDRRKLSNQILSLIHI